MICLDLVGLPKVSSFSLSPNVSSFTTSILPPNIGFPYSFSFFHFLHFFFSLYKMTK